MNKCLIISIFLIGISIAVNAQILKCVDPSYIAFTAKVDNIKSMDQGIYINVQTTITNNSSDTLRYLSMSCSWANYYVIDSRAFHLPTSECDKDTALLIQVAPHKRQETMLRLISLLNTKQLHSVKFKIGFKFVQACDTDKASKELRRSKNTIWSNSLMLK
ncbi:MAG TPA: hypothetical protein VK705_03510 [Ferruginibacter sp.]|nr:hypothetical protein [Ferruginibacter sp.]